MSSSHGEVSMVAILEFLVVGWVIFMLAGVLLVLTFMMISALTDIFRGD
jgi:hypothetical protein